MTFVSPIQEHIIVCVTRGNMFKARSVRTARFSIRRFDTASSTGALAARIRHRVYGKDPRRCSRGSENRLKASGYEVEH